MNAITAQAGGAVAVRQPPSRAEKVAGAVRKARGLLAVFDEWEAMRAPFRASLRIGPDNFPGFLRPEVPGVDQPDSEEQRSLMLSRLDRALDRQPALADVLALAERIREAAEERPNVAQTRLLVGLLVDAFPNARPHSPETYIEALIGELDASAYPPAVVAKACNMALRGGKFVPTIGEVLAKADEAATTLRAALYAAAWFANCCEHIGELRAWLERVPLVVRTDGGWADREWPPRRRDIHPADLHLNRLRGGEADGFGMEVVRVG